MVEKANHALFDEASRLQRDLKTALDMQTSSFAAAAKDREQLYSDTARSAETYAQEMQVVIDHVKRSDARTAAAEKRSQDLEAQVRNLEKMLQAHVARQQPALQSVHAGLAQVTEQGHKLATQLVDLQDKSTSTMSTVNMRIAAMEQETAEHRSGLEQSLALWGKQKATNEMTGTRLGDIERNIREVTMQVDAKLLSTVSGSTQALAQRVDRVATEAQEGLRDAVARLEAALESGRRESAKLGDTVGRRQGQLEESFRALDGGLRSELQKNMAQISGTVAAVSQRVQQTTVQLIAEKETREAAVGQVAGAYATAQDSLHTKNLQLEAGLEAISTALAREAAASKESQVRHAEILEKLADSTSQRFEELRNDWDMRSEREQTKLRGEITALKSATEGVVLQLDTGSKLLERELSSTRASLTHVINAEIRSRQRKEEKLQDDLSKLNEQDTAQHYEATRSVDQLAVITTKVCDELQRKIEGGLSEQKELLTTLHTNTESRLEQVVKHIGQTESSVTENLIGIQDNVEQERHYASKSVANLEKRTVRQVELLEKKVDMMPLQIHDALQQLQLLKSEMMARLDHDGQEAATAMDQVHLAISRKADAVALDRTVEAVRSRLGHAEEKTLEVESEVKKISHENSRPSASGMADQFKIEDLSSRIRSLEDNMIQCMEHLADQFETRSPSEPSPRRRRVSPGPPASMPSWALDSFGEDHGDDDDHSQPDDHDDENAEHPEHALPTVIEETEEDDDQDEGEVGGEDDESETNQSDDEQRIVDVDPRDPYSGDDVAAYGDGDLSAVLEETEPEEGVESSSAGGTLASIAETTAHDSEDFTGARQVNGDTCEGDDMSTPLPESHVAGGTAEETDGDVLMEESNAAEAQDDETTDVVLGTDSGEADQSHGELTDATDNTVEAADVGTTDDEASAADAERAGLWRQEVERRRNEVDDDISREASTDNGPAFSADENLDDPRVPVSENEDLSFVSHGSLDGPKYGQE